MRAVLPLQAELPSEEVEEDCLREGMDNLDIHVLTGMGVFFTSLVAATATTAALLWRRRGRRREEVVETDKTEKKIEPDFDEINEHLQNDLKNHILDEIEVVKREIEEKRIEMEQKLESSERDKEEEIAVIESKYMAEREAVEAKYKDEMDVIKEEFETELKELNESLKKFKVNLCTSVEDKERVESSRSELECPVCLEEMKPPRRIWQCSDGHPVCEPCKKKPEVSCCPTCRKYLVGRSTIAEKLARSLFDSARGGEVGGVDDTPPAKVTLTGYREVRINRLF